MRIKKKIVTAVVEKGVFVSGIVLPFPAFMLTSEVAFLAMLGTVAFFILLTGTAALLTSFRSR